jgi:fused signal recognition particle receptor
MVFDWFNRLPVGPAAPASEPPAVEPPEPEAVAESQPPDPSPVPEPASTVATPTTGAVEAATDPRAEALEWARQAYARLKEKQEADRQAEAAALAAPSPIDQLPIEPVNAVAEVAEPSPASEDPVAPPPALSLLEQAAADRRQRQQELMERSIPAKEVTVQVPGPTVERPQDQPQLGAFDGDFTWSAEVLAAQGRRLEEVSLEEIDWLSRLRRGMEKSRQGLVSQLLETLGDDPLSPEILDELESLLLRADVGVQATDQVLEALRKRLNQEVVDPSEGIRFLKQQLQGLLEAPITASGRALLAPERGRLNVWLLVGVNGVGKTTTLGKLANLAVRSGYSCLIAAADTFRAAAVEQVKVWAERSGVAVIANASANADPAAVVFDAIGAAQSRGLDLVLVDTAGRLQTKHNLMEELAKVRRIVDRLAPEAVVESLLVLDSSQGQNGLRQAMAFAQAAGLTGVVLTKLDGSSRGGVAVAVASEAGLPIRFIGAGESIRDLRPFNAFEFVEALLAT